MMGRLRVWHGGEAALPYAKQGDTGLSRLGAAPIELQHLMSLCVGALLEGTALNRSPQLGRWRAMQRQIFRAHHVQIIAFLHDSLSGGSPQVHLLGEQWVALSPPHPRSWPFWLPWPAVPPHALNRASRISRPGGVPNRRE